MTLSGGQLALLRSQGQWSKRYLIVRKPNVIYTAILDALPASNDIVYEITFNTGSGTLGNIHVGMTLMVGSTAGARDLGLARIRKTPIAGTFYIGTESEIQWTAACYLTVVDNFLPWTKSMRYEGKKIPRYIDYDIAYSDQHTNFSPVPVLGPPRIVQLTGASVDVAMDASASYVLGGATIAGHSWVAPGSASITGPTTSTPTINYTTAGHYVVYDTVTASNGKTTEGCRYVFVWDVGHMPITAFQIGNYTVSYDSGGWSVSITAQGQMAIADVEANAYIVLFAIDIFNMVVATCPGEITGCENIMACGWISEENISYDTEKSSVDFTIGSLYYWMKKLPNFCIGVENKNGTADKWTNFQNLTLDKALYHFLYWQSTIMNITDVTLTGDTKVLEARSAQPTNFWSQLYSTVYGAMYVTPGVNKYGALFFVLEPQLVPIADRTAAFPTPMTITTQDFEEAVAFQNITSDPVSKIAFSGVAYSGGGVFTPYMSVVPGFVMGHYGDITPEDNHLVSNQAQANIFAGLIYAWRNNPYPQFTLKMLGNYRVLDIWPVRRFALAVSSGDNIRGIGFTGYLLIRSVTGTITDGDYMEYEVTFEVFTLAADIMTGITFPVPVVPAPDVPQPPVIPPIPPIPAPTLFAVTFTWPLKDPAIGGVLGPQLPGMRKPVRISAYCKGGTSVTFNIEARVTPGSAGVDLMTSDLTATLPPAVTQTTFAVTAMAADTWLYLDISNVVGSVDQVVITLALTI